MTVTYLGGSSDSLTLNFSRPASGPYVRKSRRFIISNFRILKSLIPFLSLPHCIQEFYKLLRLGKEGYMKKVDNQMAVATYLRDFLRSLTHPNGQRRFQILDGGDVSFFVFVMTMV